MPRIRRPPPRAAPVRIPEAMLSALRDGPAGLADGAAARAEADSLTVALVVLERERRPGEHRTLASIADALEARGHRVAVWRVLDERRPAAEDAVPEDFVGTFGPRAASARRLVPSVLDDEPADVIVATSWQTVPAVLRVRGARARARIVLDDEVAALPASSDREWARWADARALHAICAAPELADRTGAATSFAPGVDDATFRTLPVHRREDLVLVRAGDPALPLAVLALRELRRSRAGIEIALLGNAEALDLGFPHLDLGPLGEADRAHAYNSATVGLALSFTAPAPETFEMLACGLPVVALETAGSRVSLPADGPVALAAAEPTALAQTVGRLLDDLVERAQRTRDGVALAAERTWERAGAQIEEGLRAALRSPH